MTTAIVIIVIVFGLLAGLIMGLRRSARTGMPSKDVLERAGRHARELEAREKSNRDPHGD